MVTLVLAVAGGVALLMTGAWLIQRATGNASWVDAIWPLATGLAGIAFALAPVAHWPPNARQIVLAAVIGLWALRLAGHIARRTAGAREDPRYHELRTAWGEAAQSRFRERLTGDGCRIRRESRIGGFTAAYTHARGV